METAQASLQEFSSLRADEKTLLGTLLQRFLATSGTRATRRTYEGVLFEFGEHFAKLPDCSLPSRLTLAGEAFSKALMEALEERFASQSTVRKKLSVVSSFLSFCENEGLIPKNPMKRIKRPKVTRPDKEVLTEQEAQKLLEVAKEQIELTATRRARISAERFYLALKLCLTCGCRVGELLKLRPRDFDAVGDKMRICFHAKGAQAHLVFVPLELGRHILSFAESAGASSGEFLFLGKGNFLAAEATLGRNLKRFTEMAKINKKVSVHTLRATVASLLHAKGTPLGKIQKLLGHKNMSTTEIYIQGVKMMRV